MPKKKKNIENIKIFQVSAKARIGISVETDFSIRAYEESPLEEEYMRTIRLPEELGGQFVNVTHRRGVLSLCPSCSKIKFCYYCQTDKKYDNKHVIVIHCLTENEFMWCLGD